MTTVLCAARRALAAAAWLALLTGVLLALDRLGHGPLAPPPLLHPGLIHGWMVDRDAPTMTFAVLRLVALVLTVYLLLMTVVGTLARCSHVPALVVAADRWTLPALRRLLTVVAGAGLTASVSVSVIAFAPVPAGRRAARVEVQEGPAAVPRPTLTIRRLPDRGSLVLARLPDDDPSATMTVVPDASPREEPATPDPPDGWTVRPGDSFWSVAATTLGRSWGRSPTEAEVTAYWDRLVEANRARLADPANPDLVFPGQSFTLPDPPSAA